MNSLSNKHLIPRARANDAPDVSMMSGRKFEGNPSHEKSVRLHFEVSDWLKTLWNWGRQWSQGSCSWWEIGICLELLAGRYVMSSIRDAKGEAIGGVLARTCYSLKGFTIWLTKDFLQISGRFARFLYWWCLTYMVLVDIQKYFYHTSLEDTCRRTRMYIIYICSE